MSILRLVDKGQVQQPVLETCIAYIPHIYIQNWCQLFCFFLINMYLTNLNMIEFYFTDCGIQNIKLKKKVRRSASENLEQKMVVGI